MGKERKDTYEGGEERKGLGGVEVECRRGTRWIR